MEKTYQSPCFHGTYNLGGGGSGGGNEQQIITVLNR